MGASRRGFYKSFSVSRYVTWDRVEDYELMGWVISDPASNYSAIMWACPSCNQNGDRVPQWTKSQNN
jgi:hypothetical protein